MTAKETKYYHDTTDGTEFTDTAEVDKKIALTGHKFRIHFIREDPTVKLVTPKDSITPLDKLQEQVDILNAKLRQLENKSESGVIVSPETA